MTGIWLLGGTLGGIIHKPGALFVEAGGRHRPMGLEFLMGGRDAVRLAQGIGAELFSRFCRRFNVWVVAAAGALSFACEWALELFTTATSRRGALARHLLGVQRALGHRSGRRLAWALTNALARQCVGSFRFGTRARERLV